VAERQGIVIQRYRHPPATIDVPGLRDELLVGHLEGPVLVEEDRPGGCQRRWTGAGQVSLTPAGQPVRRVLKGRPDVALLYLAPELIHATTEEVFGLNAERVLLVPRLAEPDETADRLIRLLLAEAEAPGPGTLLMTETLGRALAVHLLRFHSNLAPLSPNQPSSLPAPRIRRVIEQMRDRLDEDLTLGQLADMSGLSPSQFGRAFRSAVGQSPHRYLIGLRIERARELLEHTDLPIIVIGLRCGFEQPGHFATAFRSATGFTPRAWRQARKA
jgi:AraC family transcriptional regulator